MYMVYVWGVVNAGGGLRTGEWIGDARVSVVHKLSHWVKDNADISDDFFFTSGMANPLFGCILGTDGRV